MDTLPKILIGRTGRSNVGEISGVIDKAIDAYRVSRESFSALRLHGDEVMKNILSMNHGSVLSGIRKTFQ